MHAHDLRPDALDAALSGPPSDRPGDQLGAASEVLVDGRRRPAQHLRHRSVAADDLHDGLHEAAGEPLELAAGGAADVDHVAGARGDEMVDLGRVLPGCQVQGQGALDAGDGTGSTGRRSRTTLVARPATGSAWVVMVVSLLVRVVGQRSLAVAGAGRARSPPGRGRSRRG